MPSIPKNWIDPANLVQIEAILDGTGFLAEGERLEAVEKPGEGNMNLVLRCKTNRGSFIIKQSRPWVEKYPQINAPEERALIEGKYFQFVSQNEQLLGCSPKILKISEEMRLLKLEDLGSTSDFMHLYQGDGRLTQEELEKLVAYLVELHQSELDDAAQNNFRNRAMRKLNHAHIFNLPFDLRSEFPLNAFCDGLADFTHNWLADQQFASKAMSLGEYYLADGTNLLHGDFYPGSWVNSHSGLKIIDPEFCFAGCIEFDLGVLIAHLKLSSQTDALIDQALTSYNHNKSLDETLVFSFAAVEVARRILGVAQLPLGPSLDKRTSLLNWAKTVLCK